MYGLIDPFYEKADATKEPSHIWCDEPIYLPPRHGLKINRVSPQDDTTLDLTVCGRTSDIYDHPPIKSLKLESSEAALGRENETGPPRDRPRRRRNRDQTGSTKYAGTLIVVPVYGVDQYDEATRRRLMYYKFTNGFYLPALAKPPFDKASRVSITSSPRHQPLSQAPRHQARS